jgi:hypothetical protein
MARCAAIANANRSRRIIAIIQRLGVKLEISLRVPTVMGEERRHVDSIYLGNIRTSAGPRYSGAAAPTFSWQAGAGAC